MQVSNMFIIAFERDIISIRVDNCTKDNLLNILLLIDSLDYSETKTEMLIYSVILTALNSDSEIFCNAREFINKQLDHFSPKCKKIISECFNRISFYANWL
jgi:hypothetical protein